MHIYMHIGIFVYRHNGNERIIRGAWGERYVNIKFDPYVCRHMVVSYSMSYHFMHFYRLSILYCGDVWCSVK